MKWSQGETPAGLNIPKAARNAPSHARSLLLPLFTLSVPPRRGSQAEFTQAEFAAPLSPHGCRAFRRAPADPGDPLPSAGAAAAAQPRSHKTAARLRTSPGRGGDFARGRPSRQRRPETRAPSLNPLGNCRRGCGASRGRQRQNRLPQKTPCHRPEPLLAARPTPPLPQGRTHSGRGVSRTPALRSAPLPSRLGHRSPLRARGRRAPAAPLRAAGEAAPTLPTCGSAAAAPSPPARLAPSAAYVWPCMRGAGSAPRRSSKRGGGRPTSPRPPDEPLPGALAQAEAGLPAVAEPCSPPPASSAGRGNARRSGPLRRAQLAGSVAARHVHTGREARAHRGAAEPPPLPSANPAAPALRAGDIAGPGELLRGRGTPKPHAPPASPPPWGCRTPAAA